MIEKVIYKNTILAIIIRSDHHAEGIEFLTPNDFSQQLGYMNRKSGYVIPPHVHKLHNRSVHLTQETLFVRRGKINIDFYNDKKTKIETRTINSGDVILLASGGHGFEFLEESEVIEVKQGPYTEDEDKVRF